MDSRFDYQSFGRQPMWLIKQAVNHKQKERNLSQLSQARYSQMFANANRDPKSPPYDDLGMFVPHPHQWLIQHQERKVDISKRTAKLFLATYKSLPPNVEVTFDSWIMEIELIAST